MCTELLGALRCAAGLPPINPQGPLRFSRHRGVVRQRDLSAYDEALEDRRRAMCRRTPLPTHGESAGNDWAVARPTHRQVEAAQRTGKEN